MWDYIIINIALSLAIIVFAHYIWDHLKNTYSVKKVKSLADIQTNKYKTMIDELREGPRESSVETMPDESRFLSIEEKHWMVKELSSYLESGSILE